MDDTNGGLYYAAVLMASK